jgi:hypothetical protein
MTSGGENLKRKKGKIGKGDGKKKEERIREN